MASCGLPPLLAPEVPEPGEPATNRCRSTGSDPSNEHREYALGCPAHSRRVAQARLCGRSVDRDQVHGRDRRLPVWSELGHLLAPQIAAMDLFVVPTIGFSLLYVMVIVRLARRELAWINVTAYPLPNGSRGRLPKPSPGMRSHAT